MLVRAEQVRAVYKVMPNVSFMTIVGALAFSIVMSREVALDALAAWLAALYAAQGYALFLYFQYRRAAPPAEQAASWGTRMAFAIFLTSCAWGSAGIVMFRPEFTIYQLLLVLSLFMVTTSGLFTLVQASGGGARRPYGAWVYALATPAVVPFLVRTGLEGDPSHLVAAAGGIFILGLVMYHVADLNGAIAESIDLRFEAALARERAEEASRAKSRFLAAASHDLRQPLHALSMYSAALKLNAPQGATGEIARHIDKALGSLSALVDSLLDISKLDAGAVRPEPQQVWLRTLIERIEADYRPVAREKELEFRVAATDALVESDPVLLERLVRNLVDNAFKYTASGSVTLAVERGERTVRIAVRDTGLGIPEAERERIFEEFYQIGNPERDRAQGLGLGLAIVRRIAQLLGLEMTLESEPGRGSTFTVTMPLVRERRARAPAPAGPVAASGRGLQGARILLIDDEPEVRAGVRALLEPLGCQVAACGGYAEAAQLLDEQAPAIDLIVADFRLRQHENGIDTVRRLRLRLGEVPALLVSGDTAPERLREAQASGLPLLHKPVSADKLIQTMRALLRR